MKVVQTNQHARYTPAIHMNTIEDDETTVSYFDDYISELNNSRAAHHCQSFASSASNDDDDESTASTVPSTMNNDQSYSCNEDLLDCFDNISNDYDHESNVKKVKRVTFGDSTVREYGVTVGACTPANTGRCPMELKWEYAESYTVESKQNESMSKNKRRIRPLSVTERRERIANVQKLSNNEVRILEYEASIALIQETLEFLESSRHKIIVFPPVLVS